MENENNKKINYIIDCFKQKNIIVFNISYQIIKNNFDVRFDDDEEHQIIRNIFIKIEYKNYKKLNENQISQIFKLIKEEIANYKNRVIFIIFNEYFFSRSPISEKNCNNIIGNLSKLFKDNENNNEILFLLNFLYKLENTPNINQIKQLEDYLSQVNTDTKLFNLNPSNATILHNDNTKWFTNESIFLYKGKIIFSQKKQSYCNEINSININFVLGFGGKETKLDINEPEYELFKYFNSAINIDICLDIQKKFNYKRKKFMEENICYLSKGDQEIINNQRKIFGIYNNGNDYDKKEFYIIQSNTTNINESLVAFPNNKIIIQVDPISSGIFCTNYSIGFNDKINEFIKKRETFFKNLEQKKESFIKEHLKNKNLQEIEYSRTKKMADEEYDILIDDLYNPNFYNIIELIKPVNIKIKNIEDIKLSILVHDLKNLNKNNLLEIVKIN